LQVNSFYNLAYCYFKGKSTEFVYARTPLNDSVKALLASKPYSPSFFLPGSWLKFFSSRFKKPKEDKFENIIHRFADGGQIFASWYGRSKRGNPVLVVVPGLHSTARGWYVSDVAIKAAEKFGWRTVVYNKRGYYTNLENTGGSLFSWHRFEDLYNFIEQIKLSEGASEVFLMGYSMGAAFVCAYLAWEGRQRKQGSLTAAVAISPALDADRCMKKVDNSSLLRKVTLRVFKFHIRRWLKEPSASKILAEKGITRETIDKISTNEEFYSKVICKIEGFEDPEHYFKTLSNATLLADVRTPLLCFISLADPVIEYESVLTQLTQSRQNPANEQQQSLLHAGQGWRACGISPWVQY